MKLYLGGTEVKLWRDLMAEQKVENVGLSYMGLRRRVKTDTNSWSIENNFPVEQDIFLDSGAYTLNKSGTEFTNLQAEELAENYVKFVKNNIDRVNLVSEFDAQVLGYDYIRAMREDFFDDISPDKFMPIWHPYYGIDELEKMVSSYTVVGIAEVDSAGDVISSKLNNLVSRYGVRLHGVAMTGRKMMKEVRWDSCASMSWLSPSKFGDTILWRNGTLHRYPKDYKERCRKQNYKYLNDSGFDADKILADDTTEVLKLSMWSWGEFTADLNKRSNYHGSEQKTSNMDILGQEVDTLRGKNPNAELALSAPIVPQTSMFEQSLNNKDVAPKTLEQRRSLHSALVDMQAQRVLILKLTEDKEPGYVNPELSGEIDRLNKMLKTQADMEKQGFTINNEIVIPQVGEGFMSKAFGSSVTEKITEAEKPKTSEDLMPEGEIFEAELVHE
jgi:hypothetical protein